MVKAAITRGWPPARRAAQAERCRQQQPWRHATGPRTTAGKAICARNARTHGRHTAAMRYLKDVLRRQRQFVRAVNAHFSRSHSVIPTEAPQRRVEGSPLLGIREIPPLPPAFAGVRSG